MDSNYIKHMRTLITHNTIDTSHIELEITESIFIEDIEYITKILYELKHLGFKISLDDFGTGYSSLSNIEKLPIDTLKIDRAFTSEIVGNPKAQAIIKAIISIAKHLHIDLIAEGVETVEQAQLLLEYGCPLIQGYIISKPVPVDDFMRMLEDWEQGDTLELKCTGLD